jgi:hypothetical protein
MRLSSLVFALSATFGWTSAFAAPVTVTDVGSSPPDILDGVNTYRALLGAPNPNNGQSFQTGRREINWDGVPDARSDPNPFPGDFFNAATGGRARGAIFTTDGDGFRTSSTTASGVPVLFGYAPDFQAFSAERIFAVIGSTTMDVTFARAGIGDAAVTRGFGAVFSDVEFSAATSSVFTRLDYYDRADNLIGSVDAPVSGNLGLSFAGMVFDSPIVARVRITLGDSFLTPDLTYAGGGTDGVVMDDFIYGEPVPEPSTWAMLGAGLVGLGLTARRRRSKTSA